MTRTGVLIAFEGGEGAGKSTQIRLLAESLRAAGVAVLTSHEPGATEIGKRIRSMILDSDEPIAARSEALLFAADRAQHVATVLRPALDRGDVVICDRYLDSSIAYQGAGRVLLADDVRALSEFATERLLPNLTVLLDIAPELGLDRVRGRGAVDRIEREALDFHARVRAAFLALADSDRYLVLDASLPVDVLAGRISTAVTELIR
jgi:dTMP kinase